MYVQIELLRKHPSAANVELPYNLSKIGLEGTSGDHLFQPLFHSRIIPV